MKLQTIWTGTIRCLACVSLLTACAPAQAFPNKPFIVNGCPIAIG